MLIWLLTGLFENWCLLRNDHTTSKKRGGGVKKIFYPEFGQADDKKIILYVNSPINVSIKF